MHSKRIEDWQNAIWKIVTNPAIEVIAAIVLVLLAAWVVVGSDAFHGNQPLPPGLTR